MLLENPVCCSFLSGSSILVAAEMAPVTDFTACRHASPAEPVAPGIAQALAGGLAYARDA